MPTRVYMQLPLIFPGIFAPGFAASLPVTNLLSPSSSISFFTIPFRKPLGKFLFLYTSKHFYKCKRAPRGWLQRQEPPLYLKAQQRASPGHGAQSKHSCVEYFPHSSVHLRGIRAQLAPRTRSGKQHRLSKQTTQVRRTGI